jgi:1-aminocyclopropane-1-carboxylate deaminase/D-cysteine desulfhydrase-like pyridoxal-dependent ACC family enzyme
MILSIDQQFNDELNRNGSIEVYSKYVNEESRLLREGEQPIIGKTKILEYVSNINRQYSFTIIDGNISRIKDFGYVYGTLEITENGKSEQFNYIRMWKNESGNWEIIIELFSPLPN